MRKRSLRLLAAFLFVSIWPACAQDVAKPFQWNAELDAYAEHNFNDPASGTNALRSFDTASDAFRLAASTVDLDYKTAVFGIHLTGGYGDAYRAMAFSDRLKGPNSYLSQFYASYRPLKGTGLQIDFGKFYTSVGAEVPDTASNFNYSRSLLFSLGEPYYHFGVRATIPVTKTFAVNAQLLNGWNNVEDNNAGKTVGFGTTLTRTKWAWTQTFLIGPEKDQTTSGKRQLANEVLTLNLIPSIQSYAELLYGRDQRADVTAGADSWYGIALATRWNTSKKLSFAPRLEYYVDQTGFTSGAPQHLKEATATLEYKLHPLVNTRFEYRKDLSNRKFFEHAPDRLVADQGTVILALLVAFKGER